METNINHYIDHYDVWTIWLNNKMTIFNITDDTKTFIKVYIEMNNEMNNKDITPWMFSKNIMTIFNITQETQEFLIKYIITRNNELSDKKKPKMDCFISKSPTTKYGDEIKETSMSIPEQY